MMRGMISAIGYVLALGIVADKQGHALAQFEPKGIETAELTQLERTQHTTEE